MGSNPLKSIVHVPFGQIGVKQELGFRFFKNVASVHQILPAAKQVGNWCLLTQDLPKKAR